MASVAERQPVSATIERRRPCGPNFLSLVGHAGWWRLHPDIQRRFSADHDAAPIEYRGTMRVERSFVGLLFAVVAMALGGPLPVRCSSGVSAVVRVSADGLDGVVWERWLRFPSARTYIRSVKRPRQAHTLLECVDGGLGMVLTVFERGGGLVFESQSYFLVLGARRVPIPTLLTPGRCSVTHSAVGSRHFVYDLVMRHSLWGTTFRQVGTFEDPEG